MTTTTGTDDIRALLLEHFWLEGTPHLRLAARQLASSDPSVDGAGTATRALGEALTDAWERGWQPTDVVHVVGRDDVSRQRLAVALIAMDAQSTRASTRAPIEWQEQLHALGCLAESSARSVHDWHVRDDRSPSQAWEDVLLLAGRLRLLPPLTRIVPPPSRWTTAVSEVSRADTAQPASARVLRRIRALLAKAESTEFPEEAEALTAKAQELMSAHAVDEALLDEVALRCVLTGGQIRNAVIHATLLGLAAGSLGAAQVVAAVRREYRKAGGVCPLRPSLVEAHG